MPSFCKASSLGGKLTVLSALHHCDAKIEFTQELLVRCGHYVQLGLHGSLFLLLGH